MNVNCSHIKIVDIDSLVPNPRNPNKHGDKQIEMLAKILKYQGWRHPIVVSKRSGFIVAGHGRIDAAKLNGWDKVPVDEQEFESEAAEFAFLIADNKIAELAYHDNEAFKAAALELGLDDGFDLDLFGIPDFTFEPIQIDLKNTGSELDLSTFDNFQHECPKCGFEWNDNGTT